MDGGRVGAFDPPQHRHRPAHGAALCRGGRAGRAGGKLGRATWSGRRHDVWALVFTAVVSRHVFVWLTVRQTTEAFIDGCEAAWRFFGGVFPVMISDNAPACITTADALTPRLNERFLAYCQARGFVFDAARKRHAKDKARVERSVSFVQESFFAGETFVDLEAAQEAATEWCHAVGQRIHGTTQRRPSEVFAAEEQSLLPPPPAAPYDPPQFFDPKVRRDGHVRVDKALYSVPEGHIGEVIKARATRALVVLSTRAGQPLRTHPRVSPGGRSTHDDDIPGPKRAYATRDVDVFRKQAAAVGPHAETYVARLLENPLPMSRMRHLYRFGGLLRRYGAAVDEACRRALAFDVVDVTRIAKMLEEAIDRQPPPDPPSPGAAVLRPRFARPVDHFATRRGDDDE
ncbi:MAG: transposase [Myxococcales bacterium]|nr:transposase [Myxococcales bacterium]